MLARAGDVIQWAAALSAAFTAEQNDGRRFASENAKDEREMALNQQANVLG